MNVFNNISKFELRTRSRTFEFTDAPIGFKFNEELVRSNTGGLVLQTIPDVELTGGAKDFIVEQFNTYGASMYMEFIPFQKIESDFVALDTYYIDGKSIAISKNTVTVDFLGNEFDDVFRNNISEQFEVDRETSISGETIPPLERSEYNVKNREILLRSKMELDYPNEVDYTTLSTYFAPPLKVVFQSDERIIGQDPHSDGTYTVYSSDPENTTPLQPELSQFFYDFNDRAKSFDIVFDWDFDLVVPVSGDIQYPNVYIMLQRSLYDPLTQTVSNVSLEQVHQWTVTPSDSFQNFTYSGAYNVNNLQLNEMLCLIIWRDSPFARTRYIPNKIDTEVIENSYYEPLNIEDNTIDCIPIKQAFERITSIIDPSVVFKSDLIDTYWSDLILFSGETCRHVLYEIEQDDGSTVFEKAKLLTTSFKDLYDLINTITPCKYLIEKEGNTNIVRVEALDYTRQNEIIADLGQVNVNITQDDKKIYGKIEIGYTKSGEVEGVYLLYAAHSLNRYILPLKNSENTYKAINKMIASPEEQELTFRLQYSRFPNENTQRDKDVFVVDAVYNPDTQRYDAREWQQDFEAIENVYSKDTSWNYRLSPMNCLLRHDVGYNIEFTKSGYQFEKVRYGSTNGNVDMITTLTGGVERPENGDIAIADLANGLVTTNLFDIESFNNPELNKLLKNNFNKSVVFQDNQRVYYQGFFETLRIEEGINKYELSETL